MDSALIESSNHYKLNSLLADNCELKLKQSIQKLLAEFCKETTNFRHFIDTFYELMQAGVDVPLESIWVYSALRFRSRNFPKDNHLDRVLAAKELFHLVSSCSAPCSSSKGIALLAPVLFDLHGVVAELFGKDLASKREKKAMREMKALIEVMLGYINVCCSEDMSVEGDSVSLNLIIPLVDLIRVWVDTNEGLTSFLPLVSGEVCRVLSLGECNVGRLAGVVIAEAFLMKLLLYFHGGISRQETEKEMRNWAVGSITGFRNFYFFETLVRILLETTLPVTSLLSSEDEILLRKVLYDAVVLVDYSFLNLEKAIHVPTEDIKYLAMKRLVVIHEAIELFRQNGDQKRAMSYVHAFSSSHLPSQIINLVASQAPVDKNASQSNASSPKNLIRWLLKLEDQGIRVFDDSLSKYCSKLLLNVSKANSEQPVSKFDGDDDNIFYIDNKGEKEDKVEDDKITSDSMNAAFVTAAHTMALTENRSKKRKLERNGGEKKEIKYDIHQSSDSDRSRSPSVSSKEDSSSESEVENPLSDEDTEAKK